MEKDIKVSGRAADLTLVKKAAAEAAKEFEAAAGYPVKIEVDGELAAGSCVALLTSLSAWELSIDASSCSTGGIKITGYGSRIVVNNTLDERLRILEEKVIRVILTPQLFLIKLDISADAPGNPRNSLWKGQSFASLLSGPY